jgi:hypothetical protein
VIAIGLINWFLQQCQFKFHDYSYKTF